MKQANLQNEISPEMVSLVSWELLSTRPLLALLAVPGVSKTPLETGNFFGMASVMLILPLVFRCIVLIFLVFLYGKTKQKGEGGGGGLGRERNR